VCPANLFSYLRLSKWLKPSGRWGYIVKILVSNRAANCRAKITYKKERSVVFMTYPIKTVTRFLRGSATGVQSLSSSDTMSAASASGNDTEVLSALAEPEAEPADDEFQFEIESELDDDEAPDEIVPEPNDDGLLDIGIASQGSTGVAFSSGNRFYFREKAALSEPAPDAKEEGVAAQPAAASSSPAVPSQTAQPAPDANSNKMADGGGAGPYGIVLGVCAVVVAIAALAAASALIWRAMKAGQGKGAALPTYRASRGSARASMRRSSGGKEEEASSAIEVPEPRFDGVVRMPVDGGEGPKPRRASAILLDVKGDGVTD
jgi:hypothetical protein